MQIISVLNIWIGVLFFGETLQLQKHAAALSSALYNKNKSLIRLLHCSLLLFISSSVVVGWIHAS